MAPVKKTVNPKDKGKANTRRGDTAGNADQEELVADELSARQQASVVPQVGGSAMSLYSDTSAPYRTDQPENEYVLGGPSALPISHIQERGNHDYQSTSNSLAQSPPPNQLFQNVLSGGFFEGSNGVAITGGNFDQTYGHRNNVTIQFHVNNSTHDENSKPFHQSPTPPVVLTPASSQNVSSNSGSPSADGQGSSFSTTVYSPQNSNNIYEQRLGVKKRGFPLWIPEPNSNLHMDYRRKGIYIGDVGIITPSGGFSFLFNICLPRDHPINPDDLPEEFSPIYPPIRQTDIRTFAEFKPQSYLASAAIEKVNNDPPFLGLSFETSATEGAILTLPEGATAHDLQNVPRIRAYAAANIESWYRYINGPRGCEAKNGEVRLVIGCDKTTSWGMAAVSSQNQRRTHLLKYRSVEDASSSPIPLYEWEYSGFAEARVGPDVEEIEELTREDDSEASIKGKYKNQCLFVRTLNITLSDEVFLALTQELELTLSREFQQQYPAFTNLSVPSHTGESQSSNTSDQQSSGLQFRTHRTSLPVLARSIVSRFRGLTTSISPSAQKSHPADALNRRISKKAPRSRVIITQDEDWCSVINDDDTIMPNNFEIADRVLAAYYIMEENGIAYLEPKVYSKTHSATSSMYPSAENHSQHPAGQYSRYRNELFSPDSFQPPQLEGEIMGFEFTIGTDHRNRRRNRTTQSCLNCHTSKRKCDRKRPCQCCIQLGLTGLCVYEIDDPALRDDR